MTERQEKCEVVGHTTRQPKRELPEEFLNILRTTRDKFSNASWELADILADMEAEWGHALPRGKVADAIGTLPSEVSSLILTAQRIERPLRAAFENLPFSVFKYAARDNCPRAVLSLCLDSADDYGGSPGTVRVVRAIVKARNGRKRDGKQTWSGHVVYQMGRCYIQLDVTDNNAPLEGAAVTVREVAA